MHPLLKAEMATIPASLKPFVSIESLIDRVVRDLIYRRVQNGKWTSQERQDFDSLTTARTRLMVQPRFRHLVQKRASRK